MKSFSEILSDKIYNLENILPESNKYYAHWKKNPLKYELLSEHLDLTLRYFMKLVEANNLEILIDFQICQFVEAQELSDKKVAVFIKEIFIDTIYFHDFGKINENFQKEKMQRNEFLSVENGISSQHSILSSHLFLYYFFSRIYKSDFDKKTKTFLFHLILLFVHPITQHHGKLISPNRFKIDSFSKKWLLHYIFKFSIWESSLIDLYINFLNKNFEKLINISNEIHNDFLEYSLIKLNSSLLTASDYYSTNQFMLGLEVDNFGIINSDLKSKIKANLKGIEYNKDIYSNLENYRNLQINDLEERNNRNLNKLRQKISAELISNINNADTDKLFYIEAPTGAGKTNLSLISLVELFSHNREIQKVFYVFPFTTLITQTYNAIKTNLGLDNSEIVELHSKAQFNIQGDDEKYGNLRESYIDSLFINFPFTLLSHVRFFDILTSTPKEKNYVLHRLANSVVIIDELQSYSPSEWDKINYLIKNFSKYFNITFVIMSATLPKISKLLIDKTQSDSFNYLIKNRNAYYENVNFSKRVEIEEILKNNFSINNLFDIVLKKSEDYAAKNKNSVKCVIEFITKKRASEFYDLLSEDERFGEYEILLISGTILEPRRKKIINYLKSEIKSKIIVVTTQVIEAGVDIDMDIGFKDKSLIDSEEQIAGRINRNANKSNSKLYIFFSGDAQNVYCSDLRYKLKLNKEEYLDILQKKSFDHYYNLVFENINQANENEYHGDTLSEFKELVKNNDFEGIDKSFELIKNKSLSVFVPLKIGAKYFSMQEIDFLKAFKNFEEDISGFIVWEIYENIIHNKMEDFVIKKINLKIISSIMSKFTFSIWNNPNEVNKLRHFGEIKFGYFFLENYEAVYSFTDGLKSNIEKDINFIGF